MPTPHPIVATLTHGTDWQGQDLTGWTLSEKFDGVRAIWTGSQLITRQGLPINAHAELVAGLPAGLVLDAEIWIERGSYEATRQAVQLGRWTGRETLQVFDAPTLPGTWPQRLAALTPTLAHTPRAQPVQHLGTATSTTHALQTLREHLDHGAEGLMLRAPLATYRAGRVRDLLKLKADALDLAAEIAEEDANV